MPVGRRILPVAARQFLALLLTRRLWTGAPWTRPLLRMPRRARLCRRRRPPPPHEREPAGESLRRVRPARRRGEIVRACNPTGAQRLGSADVRPTTAASFIAAGTAMDGDAVLDELHASAVRVVRRLHDPATRPFTGDVSQLGDVEALRPWVYAFVVEAKVELARTIVASSLAQVQRQRLAPRIEHVRALIARTAAAEQQLHDWLGADRVDDAGGVSGASPLLARVLRAALQARLASLSAARAALEQRLAALQQQRAELARVQFFVEQHVPRAMSLVSA